MMIDIDMDGWMEYEEDLRRTPPTPVFLQTVEYARSEWIAKTDYDDWELTK